MTTDLATEGRIFVTADTHFGQSDACLRYDRPFTDTAAMESAIIERCNAAVGPGDLLVHLGDFVGDCGGTRADPSGLHRAAPTPRGMWTEDSEGALKPTRERVWR